MKFRGMPLILLLGFSIASIGFDLLMGNACFQAAAAMCVGMGSFSDPSEAQGLAHFLGLIPFFLHPPPLSFSFLFV